MESRERADLTGWHWILCTIFSYSGITPTLAHGVWELGQRIGERKDTQIVAANAHCINIQFDKIFNWAYLIFAYSTAAEWLCSVLQSQVESRLKGVLSINWTASLM